GCVSQVRNHHFVIDEPAHGGGSGEEITPAESFLAGISACGVLLVERRAQEAGVDLRKADAWIEGARLRSDTSWFTRIDLRFRLRAAARGGGGARRPLPGALTAVPRGRGRDHCRSEGRGRVSPPLVGGVPGEAGGGGRRCPSWLRRRGRVSPPLVRGVPGEAGGGGRRCPSWLHRRGRVSLQKIPLIRPPDTARVPSRS